jgi:purine-nucleoside phosphorylase
MGHDPLVCSCDSLKEKAATHAPRVAIVLGSGLGGLAAAVDGAEVVPYADVPEVPKPGSAVAGHAGSLIFGTLAEMPVLLFAGRVHQYQGASALEAAFPARIAAALGCETLVVTNAAGGVAERLRTGDIMLITDQMNLMGTNPLTGWPGPEGGTPFIPMTDAYDPALLAIARAAAIAEGIDLAEGVYAGLLGPSYETPAEVRMLRGLGADVVGMSTVPEVIAARALGLRTLGFSLLTNVAAGVGLSHAEVLEAGRAASADLTRLVLAILRRL